MKFDFDTIIGEDDLKNYFKNVLENRTAAHAYIISGSKFSGKKLIAKTVAKSLLCEKEGCLSCNSCKSCHQFENDNNPDVIYIEHEKDNTITVEEVRRQVVDTVLVKPYSNKYKIYIIDEAEKLNKFAQNALLKTLEEPPGYVIFFILTTNLNEFLPTILSRCIKLKVKPVESQKIQDFLISKYKIPDYEAKEVSNLSFGNLGRAIEELNNPLKKERREKFLNLIKSLSRMSILDIHELVADIDKNKEDKKEIIDDLVDKLKLWFRDVLLYKSTEDDNNIVFSSEISKISSMSNISYEKLNSMINFIESARKRLLSNVDGNKVLEILLIELKENINA